MRRSLAVLAVFAALAACSASSPDPASSPTEAASPASAEKSDLLLFTSLPIYWAEGDLGDLLSNDVPKHWARVAMESRYDLKPVDRLIDLPVGGTLFMAQPRALAGDENVALDDWVRAGGTVLLLVDPMLDVHSAYGFGDKRRPEAIAMLSPILTRWGLALSFDEEQAEGVRTVAADGLAIPVADAGMLTVTGKGHESDCTIAGEGLLARCRIGAGQAIIVADAEMLADGDHAGEGAKGALLTLLKTAQTLPLLQD